MREGPDISAIAALIGDPARANILTALMSGKALTATELAAEAGITAQTVSSHLARLDEGGLIATRRQGRHKYVTLASDEVGAVLEALIGLAARSGHLRTRPGPRDAALRHARVCYNHLAGDRGIQLYDSLVARGMLRADEEVPALTSGGVDFLIDLGVDVDSLSRARAPLCRNCLDWSARRYHLGGSLGRAMLARMEAQGWVNRGEGRVLRFTDRGAAAFDSAFPV
ncbi:ArsR family transcriptional regulator [Oceanicola sp. 22II-s10i]|uniref:ArsR/SmtB family transcription factor n=1 Tax=Oceanicola sp. 22II-s10i TaxID=1317116 RepID=UPI000B527D59|nr:winged helix-turn-helix domain-containing protein [Oceanicola sp. 22II-s10i]OWU86475.1 ArsR family transcriptional regulator [Oceanicola sp. 22II-s10i]